MSPVTFRERIPLIPGLLHLNLGRRSRSITLTLGPFHRTWSSTGRRTDSVNLPGPLGWRRTTKRGGR